MDNLEKAIRVLKQGGIVVYPTDTAFGIGCRIDNEKAVERLFEIRKRPVIKAVPVMFESISQVKEYVLPIDTEVEQLMKKYWPGALTIILPCRVKKIPAKVRGNGINLGVRIPDLEIALSLISGTGVPLIGTSANFSGENTPFDFKGLDKSLLKLVDFVVEGRTKGYKQTSTIVDCSVKHWKIIRQGSVVMPDL